MKDDTTENNKYISSVLDLFSIPKLLHQEGPTTRSQVREESRLQRIPHGKSTSKKMSKETLRKHSRSIYPWQVLQKNDDRVGFALKRSSKKMDRLASEDLSHIATQEEIHVYRGNWWIRSNVVNFDTMPTRRQTDFKKALSTLYRLKKAEDKKLVAKFLLMVATANYLVGSLLWDFTTRMDWTLIERGNLCTQWTNYSFVAWISARIWCTICRDYIGNSQRSLLSLTGGVKRTSLNTAIHEQNGYGKRQQPHQDQCGQCRQQWHDVQAQAQHARGLSTPARC